MINYMANNISTYSSAANFEVIGTLKLSDIQSIPFYGFYYKNKAVKREDATLCKEFGGDCFKFVSKYLDITWTTGLNSADAWTASNHKSHVCQPSEIT